MYGTPEEALASQSGQQQLAPPRFQQSPQTISNSIEELSTGSAPNSVNRRTTEDLEKDIEVVWIGEYSIPHFQVITVKLRHVKITNCEPWSGTDIKPSTLDVFLCEEPRLHSLQLPGFIRIYEGITVPVSAT